MKNSIDAHVEFSFKGESYAPFATIELDRYLQSGASAPSIYAILAKRNGIDTYSYLYEVMEQEEIRFDNAQGLAAYYLKDGRFDLEAFVSGWHEHKMLLSLQEIASSELGIDDLELHPEIKKALFRAYMLDRESKKEGRLAPP